MLRILIGLVLIAIGIGVFTGFPIVQLIIPFLVIALGVRLIITPSPRNNRTTHEAAASSREDVINKVGIFSPMDRTLHSDDFKGGKIVLVFSGGTIDMRSVKTSQKRIDMEIVAIFGGCKLLVPKGWKVSSEGVAILGGYNNAAEPGDSDVTLHIRGVALFGGVQIEN